MNHKTDMQAALQACVDVLLHDGVPTDPYHPRRVALAAAENALACRHDALSVAELAMIREQAAAETDDWAEFQAKEPTKEECDAMFVRKVVALYRPDAQTDEPTAWRPGSETPPVKEGKAQEFILAVRRKHAPEKVFVFAANYANNFTDDGSLSGRDGEDFTAHGWYLCGLDTRGEFDEVYEAITLNEGDEILGWQPLPKWQEVPAAAPAPVSEPSPDREQVGEALGLSYQSCALLLNVLWHHQGGSSTVGQPIRTMLGIGQYDHLTEEQLSEAKRIEGMLAWHEAPDASPSRECGERHLSNFERTVLEYIAFNEGFINTRMKAREMLDGTSECGEQHVASAPIAAWLHVFSIPGKRTEFASIARDVDIPEDFVRANQKGLVTHVAEPLYRRLAPTLSDSNPTAESPRWYSVDEIRSRLKSMAYGDEIADELSTWITTEMQLAFNKGFEKGRNAASAPTLTDEQINARWSCLDLSDIAAPLSIEGQAEVRRRFARALLAKGE